MRLFCQYLAVYNNENLLLWHNVGKIIDKPENTHCWGEDHCMAGLHFNKTGFDQKRKYVFFKCSEAVESKFVKRETSHTVILPLMVSVLLINFKILLKRFEIR